MAEDYEDHEMDVYDDNARESMTKDGELEPQEEAFLRGYNEVEEFEEDDDDSGYEDSFDE